MSRGTWWALLALAVTMGSCADAYRENEQERAGRRAADAMETAFARPIRWQDWHRLNAELAAVRDSLATERRDLIACYQSKRVPRVEGRAVGYPSLGLDPDSNLRLVKVDRQGRVVVAP